MRATMIGGRVAPVSAGVRARTLGLLVQLVTVIAVLAVVAAGVGFFWQAEVDTPAVATSVRGEEVELYGRGLYAYDSVFKATGNRGADLLMLVAGIPLLVVTTVLTVRGSLRGSLLLIGSLIWILYLYATLALGTAYNDFFIVYVALLSTSLLAFVLAVRSIDLRVLAKRMRPEIPRRGPAIFMIASGIVTLVVWLIDPVAALFTDGTPTVLETNTTLVTHALDIALIVPAALIAGVLILRREVVGYVMAISLLVMEIALAPMIVLQTIFQLDAGVEFTPAEIVGPIGGFMAISIISVWVLVSILRSIEAPAGIVENGRS